MQGMGKTELAADKLSHIHSIVHRTPAAGTSANMRVIHANLAAHPNSSTEMASSWE